MSGEIRLLIWTEPWNSSSLLNVVLEGLVCKLGSGFKINLQVIQDENKAINERGIWQVTYKHRWTNRKVDCGY